MNTIGVAPTHAVASDTTRGHYTHNTYYIPHITSECRCEVYAYTCVTPIYIYVFTHISTSYNQSIKSAANKATNNKNYQDTHTNMHTHILLLAEREAANEALKHTLHVRHTLVLYDEWCTCNQHTRIRVPSICERLTAGTIVRAYACAYKLLPRLHARTCLLWALSYAQMSRCPDACLSRTHSSGLQVDEKILMLANIHILRHDSMHVHLAQKEC
jgi:hypothetical protein